MIHFDRPWNPVRLEQRIGRVDRLGQVRDVHVTELMTSHDREFELAERVGRRAQAAATSAWLRPCDRWQRRARAAARVLSARRELAQCWLGPEGIARPISTSATPSTRCVPRASVKVRRQCHEQRGIHGGGGVALYRTEIRDRDGRLRESVLTDGDAPARVSARLRRLARLEAARASRRSAVARSLGARHRQAPAQLSLPGTCARGSSAPAHPLTCAPASDAQEAPLLSASTPRLLAELD